MAVARVAIDQAAIGNEWDYRAAPVLAALTVSAPERAQEPDAAEPETTWQRVATIILPDFDSQVDGTSVAHSRRQGVNRGLPDRRAALFDGGEAVSGDR